MKRKKGGVKVSLSTVAIGCLILGEVSGGLAGYFVGMKHQEVKTVTVIGTPYPTGTPIATPDAHAAFTVDNILVRLNEQRLANGLKMLSGDNYLFKYAQLDLVNNCPGVTHDNFRNYAGKGVFSSYGEVAEDIGAGVQTATEAIQGFMNSPTHRAAILNPAFTVVGIGVVTTPVNCVSLIFGK